MKEYIFGFVVIGMILLDIFYLSPMEQSIHYENINNICKGQETYLVHGTTYSCENKQ
ncbi:MAG: hypothetical protein [Caudoviricetes sp.]|nr:MAG: hypothetical protein [Caudoviricetes sp.]